MMKLNNVGALRTSRSYNTAFIHYEGKMNCAGKDEQDKGEKMHDVRAYVQKVNADVENWVEC